MSRLQNWRFLHARTSAHVFNLIDQFCQLINFTLNLHARGQRAAADGTPRHCQFHVRGHYFSYFHASPGTEKNVMLSSVIKTLKCNAEIEACILRVFWINILAE